MSSKNPNTPNNPSNNPDFQAAKAQLIEKLGEYYITPLNGAVKIIAALNARIKAPDQLDKVLQSNTYVWSSFSQTYKNRNTKHGSVIAALPGDVFIWISNLSPYGIYESVAKVLKNAQKLAIWVGGREDTFFNELDAISGEAPAAKPKVDSSKLTPISKAEKLLKTVTPGQRIPQDDILDLYQLGKERGDQKILDLVKTLLPLEESISKRNLKNLLREIVKGICKEMSVTAAVSPVSTPKAFSKKKDIDEMTVTGDVTGYNVPGFLSRRGGSQKGVVGSKKLGYDLTPIGKKEMERPGDRL
jgi:hypothetical protein